MATSPSFGPHRGPVSGSSQPVPTPVAPAAATPAAKPAATAPSEARRPALEADALDQLASRPLAAAFAGYQAHVDPILRGTRPVNGTTATAAELGEVQHGPATVGLSTFGTALKLEDGQGRDVSLSLDRQSALVGGSLPLAGGQQVSFNAGPIGPLGYAGATYQDGHGNALGGFVMATTGGTPGLGGNFSHVGALGSLTVSPSVLVDKVASAAVQKAQGDKVVVEQTSSKMALGNLPVSVGHAGFAVSARVLADARETQSYTFETTLAEAHRKAPKTNWLSRRIEGFRHHKKLAAMPELTQLQDYAPGAKRTLDVEHGLALSLGASAGGVQLIAGRANTHKTAATVAVPSAEGAEKSAHVAVSVSKTSTTGSLLGADLPALLAVHVGRQRAEEQAVQYKFAQGDATGPKDVLARTSRLGVAGHFVMPDQFAAQNVEDALTADETFRRLHRQNEAVESIRLAAARGGLSWKVGVMSLPSSLLGPRFGLSYSQDRGRQVHYANASSDISVVATGSQERSQRELPYLGGSSRQLELLTIDARLAVADGAPHYLGQDVLRYKESHTHARQATLADAQSLLSRAVPSKLGQLTGIDAPKPPVAMDLELEVQLVVTPEAVRRLARPGGMLAGLGAPPSARAPRADQVDFHERGMAALHGMLRGASRKEVVRIMAALDAAHANVAVNVQTNLFRTVQKAAAEVQVQAAALRRTSDGEASRRLLNEVLPEAATVADQLHGAWDVLQSAPFRHNDAKLFAQQKDTLRSSFGDLAALFAEAQDSDKQARATALSARTQSYLERVAKEREMLSPKLDEAQLERNPMDALYVGGDHLTRF